MSWGYISLSSGVYVPGGMCHGGKCPGGTCPLGKCPGLPVLYICRKPSKQNLCLEKPPTDPTGRLHAQVNRK